VKVWALPWLVNELNYWSLWPNQASGDYIGGTFTGQASKSFRAGRNTSGIPSAIKRWKIIHFLKTTTRFKNNQVLPLCVNASRMDGLHSCEKTYPDIRVSKSRKTSPCLKENFIIRFGQSARGLHGLELKELRGKTERSSSLKRLVF